MGYDIYAHFGKRPPSDLLSVAGPDELEPEEIAYLRRGARNPAAAELFRALDATEYDGEVSGTGIGRWFIAEHIVGGIEYLVRLLREQPWLAREVEFLAAILRRMTEDGRATVFVWFA